MVGYVILQFSWWAFHIFTLAKQASNSDDYVYRKVIMIAGEASVFLIVLLIGVYFVRKSFKKELELAREKRNFILSVTHELKTPIASSKLFVETLINRDLPKEKQLDILKKINSDQERLQNLVENILLAASMEDHSIQVNKKSIPLLSFIENITCQFDVKTTLGIPENLQVNVDEFYFTSVISNLHENAIKYSDGEPTIIWKAEEKNNSIRITIEDNGVGIPQEEKKKIFNLFHRIGDENTRTTKGTGIGLYMVRKIIDAHGGTIHVKNNTPKGSIFEIEFPKL